METSFQHVSCTITVVNQRFNKTGSVEDLPRTGRPAIVLTEETGWTPIDGYRVDKTRFKHKSAIQKLQLNPTRIVDLNEDDFDRRSQSNEICFEKFNYHPGSVDYIL